jgi:hypothetical protein
MSHSGGVTNRRNHISARLGCGDGEKETLIARHRPSRMVLNCQAYSDIIVIVNRRDLAARGLSNSIRLEPYKAQV